MDLRFPATLLAAFAAWFAVLAVNPVFRKDWLLENLLVFVALPVFAWTARWLRFSNFAYACLFAFLCVHEVGAHYTYSLVPWDEWVSRLAGVSVTGALGLGRNHFDRVVHFLYGLLVYPLARELFAAMAPPRGAWKAIMPVLFMWSHAVIYEMVEWGAAVAFGGDLGQAYLGTQGDVWDAQKDMGLAMAGSALSALLYGVRGAGGVRPSRIG